MADPPLDLGSGSLDHLIDIILPNLLTSESQLLIERTFEIYSGFEIRRILVYDMVSIHRTCPVKLSSSDQLGCHHRGLILEMCFGFDKLQINVSLNTIIPGWSQEDFHIWINPATFHLILELLPRSFKTVTNLTKSMDRLTPFSVAQVLHFKTTKWTGVRLSQSTNSFFRSLSTKIINLILNTFKGLMINRMDRLSIYMMNQHLADYELKPIFIDPAMQQTKLTSKSSVYQYIERTKRQRTREPNKILALPMV